MLLRLQERLMLNLMKHSFENDDEMYLYIISYVATVFGLLLHVFHLFLFALNGAPIFSWLNLFSAALYVYMFSLIRDKQFITVGLAVSIEQIMYTTLFSFSDGIDTYAASFYILVIIMQVMVPYGTVRMRFGVVAAVIVCTTASILLDTYTPPVFIFSDRLNAIFQVSNIYLTMIGTIIYLYSGNIVKLVISDLHEKEMAELSNQLNTDPLTGLYNRRFADNYLDSVASNRLRKKFCVAMLDIDDYKQVNDRYGHACGDEVLVFLAGFLQKHLRKTDIVVRWGGEEFLILLEAVELEEARSVLDKLRAKLAETPIHTEQGDIYITVTAGVSQMQTQNPYRSISHSDNKLYRGKRSGKNKIVSEDIVEFQAH